MARYRRTRKYSRYSRGRWSSNIREFNQNVSAAPGTWSYSESIMSNPTQQPTFVSQKYTVKNIEFSFTIEGESSQAPMAGTNLEGITAYIMFVPQGYASGQLPDDYNLQHPEYIMAYKYLGSPNDEYNTTANQQFQPIKIRTRLARKLDTGDHVVLFIKGTNQQYNTTLTLRLAGIVRWWTKAN